MSLISPALGLVFKSVVVGFILCSLAVGGAGVVGALPAANTNGTWPGAPAQPFFLFLVVVLQLIGS